MGVSETLRAAEQLSEFNIEVNGVVINRLTPRFEHDFLISRREIEDKYVKKIEKHFAGISIAKLELGISDIHGIKLLEEIGLKLHGDHIEFPQDMEINSISENLPIKIRRSKLIKELDDRTIVNLYLPGVVKSDLSLRGEGNLLFVGINNRENIIELNHLVDVDKTSAKFSNNLLKLEVFQPLV